MREISAAGQVVGVECAMGDLQMSSDRHLLSTVLDLTTLGLVEGSAIIIGDVDPLTRFGTLPADCDCIAWVKSIPNAHRIELTDHSWPVAGADSGAGKTIRLFLGKRSAADDLTRLARRVAGQ